MAPLKRKIRVNKNSACKKAVFTHFKQVQSAAVISFACSHSFELVVAKLNSAYLNRILIGTITLLSARFGAPARADTMWLDDLFLAKNAWSNAVTLNSTSHLVRFADETLLRHNDRELSERLVLAVTNDLNWIVGKQGWANSPAPPIQSVPGSQLRNMYFGSVQLIKGVQPLALYSRTQHVIYLTDTWNPERLLDRSILLHELVHHLQITNGVKLACPGAYEAQAYRLQIDWLRDQGVQDPYKFLNIEKAAISALSECP